MDLTYPPEAEDFRSVVKDWLRADLPAGWFEGDRPTGDAWARFCDDWNAHIHTTGWATPTWPKEYGGRGLTQLEAIVLAEELANSGVPIQPPAGGEILLGPTILHWGTPEQKERFLPPIARGEEIWCQGFSEPGSGSDLASLRTSAVRDGSDWRVDGHKIWTSQAQDSDYCFMLVRSEPDSSRHHGISYILMPMDQPGVEVRTIVQPDGTAGFAEVFFDGAVCPIDNTVGPQGEGWRVAMSTLGFERGTSATSSWQRYARDLEAMIARAGERRPPECPPRPPSARPRPHRDRTHADRRPSRVDERAASGAPGIDGGARGRHQDRMDRGAATTHQPGDRPDGRGRPDPVRRRRARRRGRARSPGGRARLPGRCRAERLPVRARRNHLRWDERDPTQHRRRAGARVAFANLADPAQRVAVARSHRWSSFPDGLRTTSSTTTRRRGALYPASADFT